MYTKGVSHPNHTMQTALQVPTLRQTFAEFREIERLQAEEQQAIEGGYHDDWVSLQNQINLYI